MNKTVSFLCRMDTIFHIQYEHEDQLNFFPIKQIPFCNHLVDSYFILHRNITSFLLKKKYRRTYYLNKCWMDIYLAVKFMWKWARPKTGLFLSLCTILIILAYAIFKINPTISECTCVFIMSIRHIYSTPVSIGAESQIFHF